MCEMALKQMLKLQMLKKTHRLNDIKLTFDIHIELLHKKARWNFMLFYRFPGCVILHNWLVLLDTFTISQFSCAPIAWNFQTRNLHEKGY